MILVDANLLLYAFDTSSALHEKARSWLEATLSGTGSVRFALTSVLAFVRIATNPTVFERPLSTHDAIATVRALLERPDAGLVSPTDRHWTVLDDLAREGQARGPLVMDAHLAALAVEHGATLYSTDRDFARFPGLRFKNPLSS